MTGNPVQVVRNCASYTFHALLDSLQVLTERLRPHIASLALTLAVTVTLGLLGFQADALVTAMAHVHQKGWPGVSAQALQCLGRRAAQTWPVAGAPGVLSHHSTLLHTARSAVCTYEPCLSWSRRAKR